MSKFEQNLKTKLIGETGQRKLSKSRVCIVGMGGTGCPVFSYLDRFGLESIYIIDPDVISESDLNRQFLYKEDDIDYYKVDIVEGLSDIYYFHEKIQDMKKFKDIYWERFDLIIDCTDNYEAKAYIQELAKKYNIPAIFSGVHGYLTNIYIYHPKYSKRKYDILLPKNTSTTEKSEGTFPTTTGILGTMVANEAIKILLGLKDNALYNKIFYYNVLTNEQTILNLGD